MHQNNDIEFVGGLGGSPRLAALLDSDADHGLESPRLVAVLDSGADGDRGADRRGKDLFEKVEPGDDDGVAPPLLP